MESAAPAPSTSMRGVRALSGDVPLLPGAIPLNEVAAAAAAAAANAAAAGSDVTLVPYQMPVKGAW